MAAIMGTNAQPTSKVVARDGQNDTRKTITLEEMMMMMMMIIRIYVHALQNQNGRQSKMAARTMTSVAR